ncbi:MAG: transcriptional regulator EpsA [Nitrosomonadaceae bacterium]|jgi:transcriptional regulator EpsA|nr:transcriptional regulator EpsA [Nitrosomonadaceae bacterium]
MEKFIILTEREMEHLFRIIHLSTTILKRHQFFLWVQGEVQSLLPHGMMICVVDEGSGQPRIIEKFSRTSVDEARFSKLCRPDDGIIFRVMSAWRAGKNRPFQLCPHDPDNIAYKHFANSLQSENLENITTHGMYDTYGETRSLFVLTQIPGKLTERHAYFLELLLPHMHMALVRVLLSERYLKQGAVEGKSRKLITEREREVLRYVQMGKNNAEIAHMLSISPLTVKNHIQKILRKLGVHNRVHAVVKAMALKIII